MAKTADVLDRLAEAIAEAARELRDGDHVQEDRHADFDYGNEVDDDDDAPAVAENRRDRPGNGPDENAMVQVNAGDLWRLVNRSRKMIRFARQGKVPSQGQRAPLCRVIKRLKAAGVTKKPHNLTDRDIG